MKRTFTFISFFLFLASSTLAGPIDPEKALEIANDFWNNNLKKDAQLVLSPASIASKAPSRDGEQGSDAQYYIFNSNNDNGFVIISGDDQLTPIVGYSDDCRIGEMPPALAEWLNVYSSYVDDVRSGAVEHVSTTAATGTRIEPMLQTSWNQSAPYNNFCPEVSGQRTPTGCTATAMAQVMKFHEWPASPKKAISWLNNITNKTETIDITKHVYDWDNMLNHYRDGYNTVQADAVAQLMVDVGKAINSSYTLSGTGSNEVSAARGLVNVFDYSPEIKVIKRNEYTYDEFISIIRENLEARQPIVHTGHGQSYEAGHAFVCDGIDKDNLLHIDWGWDGAFNGFFDLGSMAPGGSGIGGGQDRYNVGQAMIVNIRPRQADEADRPGDPTIYAFEVIDAAQNDAIVESHTANFYAGFAKFKALAHFLNWSHSTIDMQFGLSITSTDGTFNRTTIYETPVTIEKDDFIGYQIEFNVNNTNSTSKDYLQEGTYYVEVVYKSGGNEPEKMRGENNRLVLEVGKNSATLSKAQPDIEVSDFEFRATPNYPNDNMSFDVAFRNKNTSNSTVIIVPIINRLGNNTVVSSDTLFNKGEIINVFDNTDFLVTYSLGSAIKNAGNYNVSFAYDLRNSYTNHSNTVEKKRLKSIAGKSETFNIQALPDEAMPVVTGITTAKTVFGSDMYVSVNITNKSGLSSYTGTLGIFLEKDGKSTFLTKSDIKDLAAGKTAVCTYDSNSYIFNLETGTYEVYVYELVNGKWVKISHSCRNDVSVQEPDKCLLYTDERINMNNGKAIIQGDSVDVIVDITCRFGDFDGLVRMNVLDGITGILRSDYIPATIKEGETLSLNLRSLCNKNALLDVAWKANIVYYDNKKRQLGTLIINNVDFPGNGVFYVHDATDIEAVAGADVEISTADSMITVCGAEDNASMTVHSVNGRNIYSGNATAVAVESGIYVVTIKRENGSCNHYKVFVK